MSKLYRTVGVGANQQTEEVTDEKIHYYESESDLDTDLANISDDEVIFTQEGNDDRCGIPLGMVVGIMSNVVPQGFLPCNGVAFDENQYPALYTLLGDNHTPDLRECNLVGAGQSTRTILDETGHAHDVYTIGQFKDDQIQGHWHGDGTTSQISGTSTSAQGFLNVTGNTWYNKTNATTKDVTSDGINGTPRYGTTTHGKNVGVNYVIKATSGLTTEQQDYVLQSLLEADSYSTEEVATGKKWIDGKMIYRKAYSGQPTNDQTLITIQNLDKVIKMEGCYYTSSGYWYIFGDGYSSTSYVIPYTYGNNVSITWGTSIGQPQLVQLIIEYTKTTD